MFQKLKHKIAVAFLALASALGIQVHRPPVIEHQAPVTLPAVVTPVQTAHSSVPKITLGPVTNEDGSPATPAQMAMATKSVEEANELLRSESFRRKVLDGKFTETNGLTNSQIYDILVARPITIGIQFFYGSRMQNYVWKTMGIDKGDGIVYANTFYIDTPELLGSLYMHEGEGHGQNFHHYDIAETSVPYQFNDFFDSYFK